MLHVVSKNNHTKTKLCKVMHSIKILICGTGPTHSNRGLMLLIYFNSNRIFSHF